MTRGPWFIIADDFKRPSGNLFDATMNLDAVCGHRGAVSKVLGVAGVHLDKVWVGLGTACIDLGSVRVDLGDVSNELGSVRVDLGDVSNELGDVSNELGSVRVDLGGARIDLGDGWVGWLRITNGYE